MRLFIPLLVLGLCSCAELSDNSDDSLGTVQGTVFDDSQSASGSVLIALADISDGSAFVMHSVTVDSAELPYEYSFAGVDPDVEYELLVFVDSSEPSALDAMGQEDRLEIAADAVRASQAGVKHVRGINLAL
ncbi:MAG: hypothetical protein ACJAYU_002974 [Bradymonadia bacterium]|jgi:hypothetical protein